MKLRIGDILVYEYNHRDMMIVVSDPFYKAQDTQIRMFVVKSDGGIAETLADILYWKSWRVLRR